MYKNKYTIRKGDKTVTIKELKERIDYNMDVKEALKLTPKRLFSPITGEWIDLYGEALGMMPVYTQMGYTISCDDINIDLSGEFECKVYDISDGYHKQGIFYSSQSCEKIEKENDKYILKFPVYAGISTCLAGIERELCQKRECPYLKHCILIKRIEKGEDTYLRYNCFEMELEYIIEFEREELKQKKERTILNYLKMEVEFGPNKDPNLRSTIEGIAVKSDGWNLFDPKEKTIINVEETLNKDIFPIFIIPTLKLEVGDLIKDTWDTGEYFFVTEVYKSNVITVAAKDGKVKPIKPFRDARDNKYYVKLTSFMDFLDFGGDSNMMKLMMFYLLKDK